MRTIHRKVVGAFIFSDDNKILLGKSGVFEGLWCVPGGGINKDESHRDGLNRETLEETGIDISTALVEKIDGDNSGVSKKTLRDTNERVIAEMDFYDYVVRIDRIANSVKLILEDDFYDAKWFAASELKSLDLAPGTKKRLIQLGYLVV